MIEILRRSFSFYVSRKLVSIALVLGFTAAPSLSYSEEIADGGVLTENQVRYEGTVDFVHTESFKIVVDDRAFVLSRTLGFENASWSREQVVQRLEPGTRVRLELGGFAEGSQVERIVNSVSVVSQ